MKAREVADIIEEFAPLLKQEEWDNSGFCLGSPQTEVTGIIVGFDCTPELIDEAVAKGANMIVTHHPLIFHGVKKIYPDTYLGSILTKAVKNDIVVYSAHTNADKVLDGVSGILAEKLGLKSAGFLDEGGLGIIGELPQAMPAGVFISYVKKVLGLKCLRSSKPIDRPVKKVALCGGSGSSLICRAMECGADAYLAGDFTYHDFFTEKDFMIMDVGHWESEIFIVDKFISLLTKKIHNFAILKSDNNNPVYYY
ncbi:MAG: Nif3-like dinuclear metal center hexameric protein [Bacteroidales bacterium]|nr:Nif3-like dinuclear metal center hexameric protein [Bacteroidales bacterium]